MKRFLSGFWWIILFLFITVSFCCASSNYGLYDISMIPGSEITNFSWNITFDGSNQPVLTTDYPEAKIKQYGITAIQFSYSHNEDYFCDFTFTYTPNNFTNNHLTFSGYGKGMEVMYCELDEIIRQIKTYGLVPGWLTFIMKGSTETKELGYNASESNYSVYRRYSNDFFFGNGFFFSYNYDDNGLLYISESSFRINSRDLIVTFDKYGRIDSAYIPDEGYKYQKMTGLFYRDGKTYTVQELGFSKDNLVAKAALDDTNALPDPYLIDTGITDPIFWDNVREYDEDCDGILSAGEARIIHYLNLRDMGIKSLDGIEYFTGLQTLLCENNEIKHLNLSDCKLLKILSCDDNQITSLSVYPDSSFDVFSCQHNDYHITAPINITNLPGKFDPERASSWSGGTLDGTILLPEDDIVTYHYNYRGNNSGFITCQLSIDEGIPTTLNTLTLPRDLDVISAEAFVDVNTEMAIIPENVSRIENNSFADCDSLLSVVFLSTDVEIADNIFGDRQNIDIWCYENSTAYTWAVNKNYNVKFIQD